MSDEPIIKDKDVFEQAGAGLVSLLTLAATTSGAPLPVQGAMALAGSLIGLGFGRSVYRAATRRYPAFARGFLNAFDPDPVKAGEKAKAAADKPDTESLDDTMMRSFRQMMDAADESVVPIVGYMAGLYMFEQKRPDAFFRGLGRLLCDLETGELEEFRDLVHLVCTFPDDWEFISVEMNGDKFWGKISEIGGRSPEAASPHGYRIFALLKREQLARNTEPGKLNSGEAPENTDDSVGIEIDMAKQIFRIVMPPGTKLPEQTDSQQEFGAPNK